MIVSLYFLFHSFLNFFVMISVNGCVVVGGIVNALDYDFN